MKYNRVISTAVLLLLLGTTIPAFAQKDEEKGGGKPQAAQHEQQPQHAQKAQPQHQQKAAPQHAQKAEPQRVEKAQPQRAQQAQPQRTQQAQPQRTQQAQHQAQPQRTPQAPQSRGQQTQAVATNRGDGGGHYGRISDVSYNAHFGHGHSFHMGRPQMIGGYNRFQYGGYWFGYNQEWPIGWDYNDDCYVEYVDGYYYMFDLRHPGIHITLNLF